MPASATKSKADSRTDKDKAARAKEKEKAARAKEKEKAARQKEKEREAKRKEKEKAERAKEKDKAARAEDEQREAKRKEKEARAEAGPARDRTARDKTAKGRGRDRADEAARPDEPAGSADEVVQPVEEVAVPERGETDEVPAASRATADGDTDGGASDGDPADRLGPVADTDKTVRPKGYVAEALGKEDAVERSTQRPTLAASYTTRDHDVIRAWAESRGGRPADVGGTGDGGAGVLRIEFPDGPGDDSRLEGVDWASFFATFDDSDVDFLYQERVRTGGISRFHKIVRADA